MAILGAVSPLELPWWPLAPQQLEGAWNQFRPRVGGQPYDSGALPDVPEQGYPPLLIEALRAGPEA